MEQQERTTIEQNMHSLHVQKQAIQQQLIEADLALKELSTAKTAYKIVHGLMIASPVETLTDELQKKKETAQTRLSSVERQLEKLSTKIREG